MRYKEINRNIKSSKSPLSHHSLNQGHTKRENWGEEKLDGISNESKKALKAKERRAKEQRALNTGAIVFAEDIGFDMPAKERLKMERADMRGSIFPEEIYPSNQQSSKHIRESIDRQFPGLNSKNVLRSIKKKSKKEIIQRFSFGKNDNLSSQRLASTS